LEKSELSDNSATISANLSSTVSQIAAFKSTLPALEGEAKEDMEDRITSLEFRQHTLTKRSKTKGLPAFAEIDKDIEILDASIAVVTSYLADIDTREGQLPA
jgi:hypothetical protein